MSSGVNARLLDLCDLIGRLPSIYLSLSPSLLHDLYHARLSVVREDATDFVIG